MGGSRHFVLQLSGRRCTHTWLRGSVQVVTRIFDDGSDAVGI